LLPCKLKHSHVKAGTYKPFIRAGLFAGNLSSATAQPLLMYCVISWRHLKQWLMIISIVLCF